MFLFYISLIKHAFAHAMRIFFHFEFNVVIIQFEFVYIISKVTREEILKKLQFRILERSKLLSLVCANFKEKNVSNVYEMYLNRVCATF